MRSSKKYSEEDVIKLVPNVKSIAELIRAMGYSKIGGGNYETLHKILVKHSIDTSHFTGKVWNKGKVDLFKKRRRIDRVYRKWLLARAENKCEECGLSEWRGKPAALEIHHINGDDNNCENLQVLCLQCHAQTPGWRGQNKPKNKILGL